MKNLIEAAERQDVEPNPASLWWTSTTADEMMDDITISTRTGRHKIRNEKSFRFLGYSFNQAGRTQDSLEERMQHANMAWCRDVKIYRNEDVPWSAKCRRMEEHVCGVFCFGSENLSSSQAILDRMEGWETRALSRLFRFTRMEDETLAGYCTRAARTIWTKMNTPFLSETTPESIWRAM